MSGRVHIEPLQRIGCVVGDEAIERTIEPLLCARKLRMECLRHLRANFVATAANSWAEHSMHVAWSRTEGHAHFSERFFCDPLQCATPTGMHRSHGTALSVYKKYGDTVRGEHREQKARSARQPSIALQRLGGRRVENTRERGMKLPLADELHLFRSECGQQFFPIVEHVLARVPFSVPEIENSLAAKHARAARSQREAVHQPGNFLERGAM